MATLTPNFSLRKPDPADTVNVTTDIADNMTAIDTAIAARATPAQITAAVNAVIGAAPGALDTLAELATALGSDAAFSTTMTNALAGKISASIVDAAGDLIVGTADNTVGRLGKGTALQQLRVNSGATALEWATVSAGISIDGAGTSAVAAAHSGDTVTASGTSTIAVGLTSVASSNYAIALGANTAAATGTQAIAIGSGVTAARAASATGIGGVAVGSTNTGGTGSRASGDLSVAIGGANSGSGASATQIASIAIGSSSQATGQYNGVAIGGTAIESGGYGVALGSNAQATTSTQAIAIGGGSTATAGPIGSAQGAIAIGASNASGVAGARASGANSVAIGSGDASAPGASAGGAQSIAIGRQTSTGSGTGSVAIGDLDSATGIRSVALGPAVVCTSQDGQAIGSNCSASTANEVIVIGGGSNSTRAPSANAQGAIAIGGSAAGATGARATGTNSVALGAGNGTFNGASAGHNTAVALGAGSATTAANQIRLGTATEDVNIPGTLTLSGGAVTAGAWTSYTPTNTNITLGNGTMTGRYQRTGKKVTATVRVLFGSTTSFGGNVAVGLPVAAANQVAAYIGQAFLLDNGVRIWNGVVRVVANATAADVYHTESGNSGIVNATNPFTFGDTDELVMTVTYEAS